MTDLFLFRPPATPSPQLCSESLLLAVCSSQHISYGISANSSSNPAYKACLGCMRMDTKPCVVTLNV